MPPGRAGCGRGRSLAWCCLSFGIALGSYWAYYELGWGGWWFWDPVENASFMPWLAATALLHSAIVVEKRDALKSWTVLLAILAFSLSLLGTFLVRSGVLTSVHAFAVDPARGIFVLALLGIAVGGSLALYAWRAPQLQGRGVFAPISREGGLLLNNLLLATACATVLLGTLYPLLLETVGGAKISVGPPYFDATFAPLMVPLLIAVPIGATLAWKRGDLAGVLGRLKAALAITAAALLVQLVLTRGKDVLAALAMALAVWVIAGSLVELASRLQLLRVPLSRSWQRAQGLPRSAYAMTMAHVGLGVLVAGITASSAWQSEAILVMKPGDRAEVAGYQFTLARIDEVPGPNYVARRATFDVTKDGAPVARVIPQKRFYPVEQQATSEAGIDSGLWRDLYVVLGDPVEGAAAGDAHTVRIYHNPAGHVDLGRGDASWAWPGCCRSAIAATGSARRSRRARAWPRRRPERRRDGPAPAPVRPAGRHLRRGRHRARGRPDARSEHPAVGADRSPRAGVRAAAAARARRAGLQQRRSQGRRQPGQRVRVVVRAVPGRASAAAGARAGGGRDLRHQLQGPGGERGRLAGRARRPVPRGRRRPGWPGRDRLGRLRRARRPS